MNTNILKIDKEVEIAYIEIFSSSFNSRIIITEELEGNSDFEIDLDGENRVKGLEVFGETYELLKSMVDINKYILVDEGYYWGKKKPQSTFDLIYQGIKLHFLNQDHTNFVGLTIIDAEKYPKRYLHF
ncbi:hypothetical protein JFL43_02515 [Viridibacillus sp. YIM B01967]|uniref:DUF2283 domain-containing protein n=1 Tax=Viridibacillus soli TaxID=2798301 RepID=A0ABS1H2V3_9BACL|nr:DUF2283 domain-containing protein [Viridibacillus soli]MBK3493749.1 hypothetical protein [Viridibacillus soli]